jgi:hypothetical protein
VHGLLDIAKTLVDRAGKELLLMQKKVRITACSYFWLICTDDHDCNMQDGYTCLHSAAYHGQVDTVKYLIEAGGQELVLATTNVSQICRH